MTGSPYNRRDLTRADLAPTERIVLMDLLDRAHAHEPIPGSRERAKELHLARATLLLAEERLVEKGYLLAQKEHGRRGVYLPTFPAVPKDNAGREAFEAEFIALLGPRSGLESRPVSGSGLETGPVSGLETEPLSAEWPSNQSTSGTEPSPVSQSGLETSPVSEVAAVPPSPGSPSGVSPRPPSPDTPPPPTPSEKTRPSGGAVNGAAGKPKSQDFTTEKAFSIAVSRCCRYFSDRYPLVLGGRSPVVTERGKQGVKSALKAVREADRCDWLTAEAEVKRAIDLFLADEDPFTARSGHDIANLPIRLQALRQGGKALVNGRHPPPRQEFRRGEPVMSFEEGAAQWLGDWEAKYGKQTDG